MGSGSYALGICITRGPEEILPVSKIQAYVKKLLICGLVVTIVTDMEPSLSSKTSIMLVVIFNYCMLYCVFWKWYAKVNGRFN